MVSNQHSLVLIFDSLLKKGLKIIKKLNISYSSPAFT